MRFLKALFSLNKKPEVDSFSVGLSRLERVRPTQPAPSLVFKSRPKRRAA